MTISSGLYRFLAITVLLDVKDIPQVGPLQWGRITIIAGLALMERPRRWVVCIRLPEELHRRLREEATVAGWSFKAEIISRLQASFSQPKDQVVPSPPTGPC
jgi:hypothetical protein